MGGKKDNLGITFNGSVSFNGPMFDIHDNQHVHIVNNGVPQKADCNEDYEFVDLVFFDEHRWGTMESQLKFRQVVKNILPRLDVDSGRDWVAVYIAYHYLMEHWSIMKRHADFFSDIDALFPGLLTKVNDNEKSRDKRYKTYTDLLRLECKNWFIENESLPPFNEWTSKCYTYHVDENRRKRIQQLVKDLYQGWHREDL